MGVVVVVGAGAGGLYEKLEIPCSVKGKKKTFNARLRHGADAAGGSMAACAFYR